VSLEIQRALLALAGNPPAEFVIGQSIEVLTRNGRFVRGRIDAAGRGLARLVVGWHEPWTDTQGRERPGYPLVNLIAYGDVTHTRPAPDGTQHGNWLAHHPGRRAAEAQTQTDWIPFRWRR
jgi:hypothetical protein